MPWTGPVKVVRMPTIRHLKELKRSGLNAASGGFPAGSNVRIKRARG